MVWMFGGGYQVGSNVQYPGHFLASRGVIIATVNYRVNKFGEFSHSQNISEPQNLCNLRNNNNNRDLASIKI